MEQSGYVTEMLNNASTAIDSNERNMCYQPSYFRACGVIMEIIGTAGIAWSLLVLYALWRHGHVKSNVAYIPLCSLTIATCGQLFLVVLHLAPEMLDRSIDNLNKTFSNYMFFPFWYAILSSVWLMAANRCAVAFSVNKARKIFTRRLMFLAALIGWALGIVVGGAGYGEGVLDNSDFDSGVLSNCSHEGVHSRLHAFNWIFHSHRSTVLTATQTFDCLTLIIVAICYGFVIYRLKRRGGEIADQLNGQQQVAPVTNSASNRRLPAICAAQAPNSINVRCSRPSATVGRPGTPSPIDGTVAPSDIANPGARNVDPGTLWFVTLQFGLLSLSVGLFAIIIQLGNVGHSSALLLVMEILYPSTSVLNIILVSTTSRKLRSQLIDILVVPYRFMVDAILEIRTRYHEQKLQQKHKPPVVVISRAEISV